MLLRSIEAKPHPLSFVFLKNTPFSALIQGLKGIFFSVFYRAYIYRAYNTWRGEVPLGMVITSHLPGRRGGNRKVNYT